MTNKNINLMALGVFLLHLALLVSTLPDYRTLADSAYHAALARQYAEHGWYQWDDIHYAPAHRPNLQGPVVHILTGTIGYLLGGEGDDFVAANALMSVLGWVFAMASFYYFARKKGGDLAGLLALSIIAGGAYMSGSYAMNIPSGWMFAFTPWAIYWFVNGRLGLCVAMTTLVCYTHLGGFATAPFGIFLAAVLAKRWRDLLIVGLLVTLFTSPYWWHFVSSLHWYVGQQGDTAWWFDPIALIFWIVGVIALFKYHRHDIFFHAWLFSPLAWVLQDPSRFLVQGVMPGIILGAMVLAQLIERQQGRLRRWAVIGVVGVATVYPVGVPALGAEIMWLVRPYPRMHDWAEIKANATVIESNGLLERIVQAPLDSMVSALAIWADIRGEKGHWVEVRPAIDPADDMSVGEKIFLIALPPTDEVLSRYQALGWIRVHGGGNRLSIIEFISQPDLSEAEDLKREIWENEARWISENSEANVLGNHIQLFFDEDELPRRQAVRSRAGWSVTRMQIAVLAKAYAMEALSQPRARELQDFNRTLAVVQALLSDDKLFDFRSREDHEELKSAMSLIADAASNGDSLEQHYWMITKYKEAVRGSIVSLLPDTIKN